MLLGPSSALMASLTLKNLEGFISGSNKRKLSANSTEIVLVQTKEVKEIFRFLIVQPSSSGWERREF